jgi:predicted aspartyl protease/transposase InsO family protein
MYIDRVNAEPTIITSTHDNSYTATRNRKCKINSDKCILINDVCYNVECNIASVSVDNISAVKSDNPVNKTCNIDSVNTTTGDDAKLFDGESAVRNATVVGDEASAGVYSVWGGATPILKGGHLLTLPFRIEGDEKEYDAVVDTGATHTLLRSDLFLQEIGPRGKPQSLVTAGGGSLRTEGVVTVKGFLRDSPIVVQALLVKDLHVPFLIGLDWLEAQQAVVDMKRRCIHYGDDLRQTLYSRTLRKPLPGGPIQTAELAPGIPDSARVALTKVLEDYADRFAETGPLCRTTEVRVFLKNPTPFRLGPFRQSEQKKRQIQEDVEQMMADGVIEPSSSPYLSPVVLVPKKDGSTRFCVDYRRLNSQTEDEATTLPLILETLKDLGTAKVFSSLDLRHGYWQLKLHPETKPLTAFATADGGCYQFRVLPFGLKQAVGAFQRLMSQEVLIGLVNKICLVYLDDIIVYSNNWEEHAQHLRLVFERLQFHELRVAPKKCQIGRQAVDYLGHHITETGNEPQEHHLAEVESAAVPKTRRDVRAFLGLCNWLREYVPRFAEMAVPLTKLLRTTVRFRWDDEAEVAFRRIKDALKQPLRLARPDFERPFCLQTDASGHGIAAVLFQPRDDGGRDVISYASKRVNETEARYHINELEAMAAVWGITKYRGYLEDRKFKLITDNQALTWLNTAKNQKGKLARWAILLSEYNFEIEHCPGSENHLADHLSRFPQGPAGATLSPEEECARIEAPTRRPEATAMLLIMVNIREEVIEKQKTDPRIMATVALFNSPDNAGRRPAGLAVRDGMLVRISSRMDPQLVVPAGTREDVMRVYHDQSGHPGAAETDRSIKEWYHWKKRRRDVERHVRSCEVCATRKRAAPQPPAPQTSHMEAVRPWEILALDLMGPYPTTSRRNKYLLVMTDMFSRWVEAFVMRSATVSAILPYVENQILKRYGYPRAILTDNGTQFDHPRWRTALEKWGIKHWTTAIYMPRCNPTERRNQEIKKGLRVRLASNDHDKWDLHVPDIMYDLRCRRNAATGFSPAEVLWGFPICRPGHFSNPLRTELDDEVRLDREEMNAAVSANQAAYFRRRGTEPTTGPLTFETGDRVYTKEHPKKRPGACAGLDAKWSGPHTVIMKVGQTQYFVNRRGRPYKFHVDQLRRYLPPVATGAEVTDEGADDSVTPPAPPDVTSASLGDGTEPVGPSHIPTAEDEVRGVDFGTDDEIGETQGGDGVDGIIDPAPSGEYHPEEMGYDTRGRSSPRPASPENPEADDGTTVPGIGRSLGDRKDALDDVLDDAPFRSRPPRREFRLAGRTGKRRQKGSVLPASADVR